MNLWVIHIFPGGIGKRYLTPDEIREGRYVDASCDMAGTPAWFPVGSICVGDGEGRLATGEEIAAFLVGREEV
ncbi:MAG: hypothetical protein FJY85_13625 [Deltaproteobacteria bacterium]|nr:hypothetical protein [Deltaproteobacteria bacterium]